MKPLQSGLLAGLFCLSSLIPFSSQSSDSAAHDACGKAVTAIIESQGTDEPWIPAKVAYECLIDVPFHEDEATHTLQQIRLFLNFYSAQAYFAKPPTPELELNPVDLNKTLDNIESNIKDGKYSDEYSFNKELFELFGDYRDGHVQWLPTCYVAFIFQHEYPLLSIAKTPDCLPEIYVAKNTETGYDIGDKVLEINGVDAAEYLMDMANNHPELGWVDPDARYNSLFVHTNGGIVSRGAFALRRTYDDQDLTLTLEGDKEVTVEWVAYLVGSVDSESFHSTDTFYKKVCIRPTEQIHAVYKLYTNPSVEWEGDAKSGDGHGDHHHHTPKRSDRLLDPVQKRSTTHLTPEMAMDDGEIELYVLDNEIGVIVITGFDPNDEEKKQGFQKSFALFISDCILHLKDLGVSKVMLDLTGNGGGFLKLGRDATMQFFPEVDHFFGTNMRWNPALDVMLTEGKDPNRTYWDIGHYHTMDGGDFSSYREFLGPYYQDDDYFTAIARPDWVESVSESTTGLPLSYPGPAPFDAKDIVIVSSGMCGSTCAVFAEAMLEQGVHSVAFGGRPREGPMQTVGGIKGSQVLKFDEIAGWAYYLLGDDVSKYEYIPEVPTVNTVHAAINLRNSWRKDDQDMPIEFIYDRAEYRLSYTEEMINYPETMWEAAREVVWGTAKDISGDNNVTHDSVGSAANDDTGDVISVSLGQGDDTDKDKDKDKGSGKQISWNSLGELIWMKIDGHALKIDQ